MDLDKITDIELLRSLCKRSMACLAETIETPTHTYKKGEWYFCTQDEDGVFLYLNNCSLGLQLTYDEAEKFLL